MRRTLAMSAMGGGIAAGALAMVTWVSLGGPSWAGGPEPPVAAPWHSPHGCPDAVVTVPIQIERWVEASAATVIVEASLTVDPAGLAKARAEAHGSPDTRADRLVVAATVELVEPRCAGSASGGGRP
jgi:hypothetical protein